MDGKNIEVTEMQFAIIRAALQLLSSSVPEPADLAERWPGLFAGLGPIPAAATVLFQLEYEAKLAGWEL